MMDYRELLFGAARSFNEYVSSGFTVRANESTSRPGDEFNQRASWEDVLSPHGWEKVNIRGEVGYWRRPGKDGRTWSATTGKCRSEAGNDLLYVFSSNAAPFEAEQTYSKFSAYTLLNHKGNFQQAAQDLIGKGYGKRGQTRAQSNGHAIGGDGASEQGTDTGPVIYTLPELLEMEIPPPRWAVPGLLAEGLSILAGKPKLGKSWMALNLGLTVAAGGTALGEIKTIPGDVLYLSLEDKLRRVQDRARKLLKGLAIEASARLHLSTQWPKQNDGGLRHIKDWLQRMERPVLVIIDVWVKFRPGFKSGGDRYEQDYDNASQVKELADKYSCSVLALHHCKKAAAEDVVDEISGTLGLAGAADGTLILSRARSQNEGKLFITGRDIDERELALTFEPDKCVWRSLGLLEKVQGSKIRTAILEAMQNAPSSKFYPKQMAELIDEDQGTVKKEMWRMAKDGMLMCESGRYSWPPSGGRSEADEF